MVTYRPIKVKEETYRKIMVIKGTLEQVNQRNITVGETVDAIFLAACEELATRSGKPLPQELYLPGTQQLFEGVRIAERRSRASVSH